MTEERRAAPRRTAHLAGEIETTAGKASIAITRDVSSTGLLVFSRREMQVGDAIKIRLIRGPSTHEFGARVVRQERLSPDESSLWRTKVGIAIDEPDALAKVLSELDAPID